jgi:transcriptional regulator with GAF, ATPase, and Fis domain/tetratricopeptide (TPR) repeat protein
VNRSSQAERQHGVSPEVTRLKWQELPDAVKFGDVCYQAERYGDALEAYQTVLGAPEVALPPELRARLHYRIACCYSWRNSFALALEHLDEARRVLPRHLDRVRLAKIYSRRGHIMLEMGRYDRAERYLTLAKKILSGTNEQEEMGTIEMSLGMLAARLGRSREARQGFLNALTTYQRIGHKSGEAGAFNNLGIQYKNACEWREAVRYLEEARTLFQRLGHRHRLMTAHLNLGIVHWKLGKWELSEENLAVAEGIAREIESKLSLVRIQLAQGNLALRRHLLDLAEGLYRQAGAMAEAEGYGRERILAQEFMGELLVVRGDAEAGSRLLSSTLEAARALAPGGDLVTEVLRRLAMARLEAGAAREALDYARESSIMAGQDGDRYEEAVATRVVGLALIALGEREEGERVVGRALECLGEIGESFQKGLTHLAYGRVLAQAAVTDRSTEDLERAATQLQRAYGAFLDLDARVGAARAAYERAWLETRFHHYEEAAAYLAKARQVYPPRADADFGAKLEELGTEIEDAFAERWSSGGDVLTSLRELKRLFQGASDTDAVLEELIRLAVTRSGSDRGSVAYARDKGPVRVTAAHGWSHEQAERFLRALGPTLDTALRDNRPIGSNNTHEDSRFRAVADDPQFRTRSIVLLPLTLTDEKSGVLLVEKSNGNIEGAYHQGEIQLLTILANLAALSLMERWNNELFRENEALKARIALDTGPDRFVTQHPELQRTLELVAKVANSPVSILIEGETGTGKGLLAQIIHQTSDRRAKPFVQVNCAALPEPLLESELFGHVKGAFTGATYNKTGLFKEAEEGTLFLDEVDKASLAVQAKLLHVMDTKEVRPVGSVKSHRVDTRVLCATNVNLRQKIAAGEFLEDLYYRLNDFIVLVPPLRERREDIPLLIEYFVNKFSTQYGRPEIRLTPEVRRTLVELPWRGNVRELEKTIRRLAVLADDSQPVGTELLPAEIQVFDPEPQNGSTLRQEIARTERRVIAEALKVHAWNKAKVARSLQVSYPCLLKKIREFGLTRPSARSRS